MASIGQPSVHDITDKIVIGGVKNFGSVQAKDKRPFQNIEIHLDPPRYPTGVEVNLFSCTGDLGQMMETACIDFLREQRGIDVAVLRQTIADLGERQCLTASRHARRPRRNQVVV